jgi:hypothetical protein
MSSNEKGEVRYCCKGRRRSYVRYNARHEGRERSGGLAVRKGMGREDPHNFHNR